jgi:enoyl-CoA hydratase
MSTQNRDAPKVTVERDGHVLLIGLNRPDKRNAFDLAMINELSAGYEYLAEDDALRVGVLYAHGEHFSAGLDLSEFASALADNGARLLAGMSRFDPLGIWKPPVPKPIVMAAGGIAYTLSIELALASDIVVVSSDVRFCQLEVGRGLFAFEGGAFRAPMQLGWGNAMHFLLTAEEFGADTALRIGLAQEIVSPGEHVDRARELADLIASRSPVGVQATLATARAARQAAESAAAAHIESSLPSVLGSEDAREGLASFLERRQADFG